MTQNPHNLEELLDRTDVDFHLPPPLLEDEASEDLDDIEHEETDEYQFPDDESYGISDRDFLPPSAYWRP